MVMTHVSVDSSSLSDFRSSLNDVGMKGALHMGGRGWGVWSGQCLDEGLQVHASNWC